MFCFLIIFLYLDIYLSILYLIFGKSNNLTFLFFLEWYLQIVVPNFKFIINTYILVNKFVLSNKERTNDLLNSCIYFYRKRAQCLN